MTTTLHSSADTVPLAGITRAPSSVARVLDFVSDWAVAGFAVWTLLTYLAALTRMPVTPIIVVWLCVMPLFAPALLRLRSRAPRTPMTTRFLPVDRYLTRIPRVAWVVVAVLCAAVAGYLAALRDDHVWVTPWLLAVVAVAVAVFAAGRRAAGGGAVRQPWAADVIAAAIALGLAVFSLFVFSTDGDDPFYVNRAVAVAQLNVVPTNDVVFTQQTVPPIAGAGLPLDSMAVLQGALAGLIGVPAASVAYFVTPPVGTFLAVWALWRLLRSWAPRRVLLCFALAVVFLLFSGVTPYAFGNFHLTRMWQGKVVFVAWLVPMLYTYLTAWATWRSVRTGVLLIAGGVAALGLTASATFAVPLVMTAGGLLLLVRREWRALAIPIAALAFPLVAGFTVTRFYPVDAASTGLHPVWDLYRYSMGVGLVGAVAGLALWAGPWLARAGAPARVVTGICVVAAILLIPGLFTLLVETQGIGGTLWRMFWVVPAPALAGLLAAVPVPHAAQWSGVLPGAAAVGLLIGVGQPIWIAAEAHPIARPAWKNPPAHLNQARAVLARYGGPGPILAPPETMRAISLLTARPKAVNARSWYASILPEDARRTKDRFVLTRLAIAEPPWPSHERARAALENLRVGLVCVRDYRQRVIGFFRHTAPYRVAFRTPGAEDWHGLVCLSPDRAPRSA